MGIVLAFFLSAWTFLKTAGVFTLAHFEIFVSIIALILAVFLPGFWWRLGFILALCIASLLAGGKYQLKL